MIDDVFDWVEVLGCGMFVLYIINYCFVFGFENELFVIVLVEFDEGLCLMINIVDVVFDFVQLFIGVWVMVVFCLCGEMIFFVFMFDDVLGVL